MALWELEEFQGPTFLGFVRNVPAPPQFVGNRWLPNQTINDLAFEYILGSNERPVMAHVMSYDAESPIHGRPGLGQRVQGNLPPIKRKARIGEKEIIRFLTPRAGTPDRQQAIDSVYNLAAQLLDAVESRVEWLRMRALSEDTLTYDQDGIVIDFDYGIEDTYQITLGATAGSATDGTGATVSSYGSVWTDTVNSTPLADLETLHNKILDETGFPPREYIMSNRSLGLMLRSDSVQTEVLGTDATRRPNRNEVETYLTSVLNLAPFTTYDVRVNEEQDDGSYTTVRTMAENKLVMVPSANATLGNTLWGPTAESRILYGTPLAGRAPGTFGTTYATEEPPAEWIKAAAISLPSMPGANLIGQMTLYSSS